MFDVLFRPVQISASAMAAERTRLEVVAANIANAYTTRTDTGLPYRRKEVVFETLLPEDASVPAPAVTVREIVEDQSPFQRVYDPTHPDADPDGYVLLPNVNIPLEMANLITASRAYEANVRVLRTFRQMVEQALQIARG